MDTYSAVWEDGLTPSMNPHFINNGFDDGYSLRTLAFFNANRLRAAKSFVDVVPGQESIVKGYQSYQAGKNYLALRAMADQLHDRSRLADLLKRIMTIKQKQATLSGSNIIGEYLEIDLIGILAEAETSRASEYYGDHITAVSEWLHWRAFTEMRVGGKGVSGPALRICRELAKGSLGYDALGIDNFIPEPKGHWVIAHNLDAF